MDLGRSHTGNRVFRVAIAGGHTQGHVSIGLAIAQGLEKIAPATRVLFCGARGGIELSLAKDAGWMSEGVRAARLRRSGGLLGFVSNLTIVPAIMGLGTLSARSKLLAFQPDVVVGVGSFVSAPWLIAAELCRVPTVVHEANVRPGLANRLLSRRATLTLVSDEQARTWLTTGRVEVTGTPVYVPRTSSFEGDVGQVRKSLGLDPERRTLLVTGGTFGSRQLNAWMLRSHRELQAEGIQVLWQCGSAHVEDCMARALPSKTLRIVPLISDMHAAYRASDLVVSAAGASTLAELEHHGCPAIVVPSLGVADEHQLETGRHLAESGWELCQPEHVQARLLRRALDLLADADLRRALVAARQRQGAPNRAESIARRILDVAAERCTA